MLILIVELYCDFNFYTGSTPDKQMVQNVSLEATGIQWVAIRWLSTENSGESAMLYLTPVIPQLWCLNAFATTPPTEKTITGGKKR